MGKETEIKTDTQVYKALQKLVVPQFICPNWIIWTRGGNVWTFSPDHVGDFELIIDFNTAEGVRVTIADYKGTNRYHVDWADPHCDKVVVDFIKTWLVSIWEETGLADDGYANPATGTVRLAKKG